MLCLPADMAKIMNTGMKLPKSEMAAEVEPVAYATVHREHYIFE